MKSTPRLCGGPVPRLETLEERLPLGDTILSGLLAGSWLGSHRVGTESRFLGSAHHTTPADRITAAGYHPAPTAATSQVRSGGGELALAEAPGRVGSWLPLESLPLGDHEWLDPVLLEDFEGLTPTRRALGAAEAGTAALGGTRAESREGAGLPSPEATRSAASPVPFAPSSLAPWPGVSAFSVADILTGPFTRGGPDSDCDQTSVGFTPVNDLGTGLYLDQFQGGLYPDGLNEVPPDHAAVGLARAESVQPLDTEGNPDPNGTYILMSIGMSATTQEFCKAFLEPECNPWTFKGQADDHPLVNHEQLMIVNGAIGGTGTAGIFWAAPDSPHYNRIRDTELSPRGLAEAQVQTLWIKLVNQGNPRDSLPNPNADAYQMVRTLGNVVRVAQDRYPNLQQVFFSSRIYGGYSSNTLHPEPFAYESGFGVKWLIEAQIRQMAGGGIDPLAGDLDYNSVAPWLAWGPYNWADGLVPRSDGLIWECQDMENDGTHPSALGESKVGSLLLDFMLTSPFSTPWFRADTFPRPTGIYALSTGQPPRPPTPAILSQPFVDGWALRMNWRLLEPAEGVYDFRVIDEALAALEPYGKKLTIWVIHLRAPDYLVNNPKVETYQVFTGGGDITTPVPWDPIGLERWAALNQALANHPVLDGGVPVPLRDHSLFANIPAQVLGLNGVRDPFGRLTTLPSYDRNRFTSGMLASIQPVVEQFPNQFKYVSFFNMVDSIPTPPLGRHLLETLQQTYFNGSGPPVVGLYQENLACFTPRPEFAWPLYEQQDNTFTMFQMLQSWLTPPRPEQTDPCLVMEDPPDRFSGISGPDIGVQHGHETYSSRYFEIYTNDLLHPGFADEFQAWHDYLHSLP